MCWQCWLSGRASVFLLPGCWPCLVHSSLKVCSGQNRWQAMDVRIRQRMLDSADIGRPDFAPSHLLAQLNEVLCLDSPEKRTALGKIIKIMAILGNMFLF